MDIISLLITIAGILIILALYILGRVSRSKMPQEKNVVSIPNIVDENGARFTSVLDDIPATDGFTAKPVPVSRTDKSANSSQAKNKKNKKLSKDAKKQDSSKQQTTQNILFISAKDEKGLEGKQIDKVLSQCGLTLGDMDIYHYMINTKEEEKFSLFRVANGVQPWTLRAQDLRDQWIPGLSLLLVSPTPIDDQQAIETFINTSKMIADKLNGELKNQQQQLFTQKDKDAFL